MGRKKELLHTFQLSYKWQSSKEVLLSWFLEVISKGGKLNSESFMAAFAAKGKKIIFYTRNIFFDWKFGYFFSRNRCFSNLRKMDVGDNYQEIGLSLMFTQSAYVSLKIYFFLINPIFFKVFKVFICRLFSDVVL